MANLPKNVGMLSCTLVCILCRYGAPETQLCACVQNTAHSQTTKKHNAIAIPVASIMKCGAVSCRSTESLVLSVVGGNRKANRR